MKFNIILASIFLLLGCQQRINLEHEKQAILTLHDTQRQAHFEKNVEMLIENDAADFIQVNRGKISSPSRQEKAARFQAYFDAVAFVQWDDVTPPIISFSDDATMATAIVNKMVVLKLKQENMRLDTTYFAWLAVYKKTNGHWELYQMASTNQ